ADGIYKLSEGQHFPLHLKSYVNIIGESRENTILDGEGEIQYFIYNFDKLGMFEADTYDQYLCEEFSVKNLSFDNVVESLTIYTNESAYHTFDNIEIKNATLHYGQTIWSLLSRNATYKNITLADNQGTGISMQTGLGTHHLENIVLKNNLPNIEGELSGGVFLDISNANGYNPDVTVNIFNYQSTDNFSTNDEVIHHGSSLSLYFNAKVNLINSTLANNLIYVCGAVGMAKDSELNIYNSIIHNNSPRQILLDGTNGSNTLRVYNSLVDGGPSEAASYGVNNMYWNAESNLYDADPLFQGEDSPFPYALTADSPCIDAGTTELPDGLQLPATDLAGNPRISGETVDMGAYEFTPQAAPYNLQIDAENGTIFWQAPFYDFPESYNIYLDGEWYDNIAAQICQYQFDNLEAGEEYLAGVSAQYGTEESDIAEISFVYNPLFSEEDLNPLLTTISNYPNPFGATENNRAVSTTIKFQLAESGQVDLAIYNAKGQKVSNLMQAKCSRGTFQMQWDGRDDSGKSVASGTYFIKLKLDNQLQQAHKITLLK
ncbi:MAG: FlgD immunoglobulin-like domain containing protein, partial [Candidatus Cloacimonadales bacterium]